VPRAYEEKGAYENQKKGKGAYKGQNEGNRPSKIFGYAKNSKSA
jgi:hypothetical protein